MNRGTTWLAAALVLIAGSASSNAQSADKVLAQIKAAKRVAIGFRETAAPFAYLNESHQPAGYSIDICRYIVKAIGASIGDPNLEMTFTPVTPQSRIPLIANGTIQMECGTTVNSLARQRQVDFTYAVALSEGRMLVLKGSGITNLQSLQGKVVAIASGTTADRYVPAALKSNKVNARIIHVKDNDEGLLAVSTNRADAFVNDAVLLGGTLKHSRDKDKLEIVGEPLSFEQVAFMIPKNNSALMTIANTTIARMLASGELQSLYDKWVAPYGAPREGVTEALFKVEAIEE